MSTRAFRRRGSFAVVLTAGILTACGSAAERTGPLPLLPRPSFSISMSGDLRGAARGVPTSTRAGTGYRETNASGVAETTAVVLLSFRPSDGSQPTVIVGLMGPIQTGTYTLRSVGSIVPGSKPEFYGLILQSGSDGMRNFTATSGTVTLRAVGDTLRGSLALHYGSVVLVPPNSPAGTKFQPAGASVDATGEFVVPAPTVSIP